MSIAYRTIHQDSVTTRVGSAAVMGSVAGVAMAGWAMATSLLNGTGFITPVQLIAATVFGEQALTLTIPVLLTGLGLHMATSAGLGAVVGPLLKRSTSLAASELMSIVWGIVAWAVFTFAILPVANPVMDHAVALTPVNWFVGHVIFGVVLGLTPLVANKFDLDIKG